MINLYVDDVRKCPYVDWVTACTVGEAIAALSSDTVNECSLDHDLGACESCIDKREHTGDMLSPETTFMNWCPHAFDGTYIVRWMMETGHWPKQKPTVHSANPAGSKRMIELINQYWGQPALGPLV